MKSVFCISLILASMAFSGEPAISLHYQFVADDPFYRNDVVLKDSLLYMIRTQNDRVSRLCLMAELKKEEIEKLQKFRPAFQLSPTRDDSDYECGGSRFLFLKIAGETIFLREACKKKKAAADISVDSAMDKISNFLIGIVERKNSICGTGYYLNLRKLDGYPAAAKKCTDNPLYLGQMPLNPGPETAVFSGFMAAPWLPQFIGTENFKANVLNKRLFLIGTDCYEIHIDEQKAGGFGVFRNEVR